jgi:hypothetical protein
VWRRWEIDLPRNPRRKLTRTIDRPTGAIATTKKILHSSCLVCSLDLKLEGRRGRRGIFFDSRLDRGPSCRRHEQFERRTCSRVDTLRKREDAGQGVRDVSVDAMDACRVCVFPPLEMVPFLINFFYLNLRSLISVVRMKR